MVKSIRPHWIGVDWGTSRLRAWAMDQDNAPIASRQSDEGMRQLEQHQFEDALLRLVADWLEDGRTTEIAACGMVGARQGWKEAPYRSVPCHPAGVEALVVTNTDPRIRVSILPGLMQNEPPDVMRGEETQIAGFLAHTPRYAGVLCLPGTHSKWVRVADGKVVDFTTFMTGELFALLAEQSVLRHGIAGTGWDGEGFREGLVEGFASPDQAMAKLFSLRAAGLMQGLAPETARAKLSGLLLGCELAATRTQWQDTGVVVIGSSGLASRYAEAITILNGKAELADGDAMTLAGLVAAYRQMRGEH